MPCRSAGGKQSHRKARLQNHFTFYSSCWPTFVADVETDPRECKGLKQSSTASEITVLVEPDTAILTYFVYAKNDSSSPTVSWVGLRAWLTSLFPCTCHHMGVPERVAHGANCSWTRKRHFWAKEALGMQKCFSAVMTFGPVNVWQAFKHLVVRLPNTS